MNVFDYSFAEYSAVSKPMIMFAILCLILGIVASWRIFEKAGEKGWKSIIPIYNTYILFKITYGNGIFFLLLLIPIVDVIVWIIMLVKLAQAFGHGIGFTIGLILLEPIFLLVLAFNGDQYQSPEPAKV